MKNYLQWRDKHHSMLYAIWPDGTEETYESFCRKFYFSLTFNIH